MLHIALVEDDQRLAQLISQFLRQNQFKVTVIDRGDQAIEFILGQKPDLVILDINLPYLDGFTICRSIRNVFASPILFLTAKDSDFDHVSGLEMGADDYIIKPIEPHVLLARIHNALRRGQPKIESQSNNHKLQFGKLSIEKHSRIVTYDGQDIELTSHEFELLWLLASHAGEVQSRDYIHKQMIGREYDGLDRSVDVRVSRLRKKLFDDINKPYRFVTVWGKGYVFSATAWD
ncbi:response regulator [Catenovulum maritimum]|uniref:Chemotaxis protein CheY n=1 Tax=Catenovulum maritimum TaxID=1513271 RepID=A0A0J8GQ73_9ALTE|nr:response regulator [Catenovulum maritimum]KMT64897.1 chemotaxis protein CheY [Catenovulum maritimum]